MFPNDEQKCNLDIESCKCALASRLFLTKKPLLEKYFIVAVLMLTSSLNTVMFTAVLTSVAVILLVIAFSSA